MIHAGCLHVKLSFLMMPSDWSVVVAVVGSVGGTCGHTSTCSPPNFLTPRYFGLESRPLLDEPPAFLVAVRIAPIGSAPPTTVTRVTERTKVNACIATTAAAGAGAGAGAGAVS
jgi:hypothetical protein